MREPSEYDNLAIAKADKLIDEWIQKGNTHDPLDLERIDLREIPSRVRSLKNLRRLGIRKNRIWHLPDWLPELTDLTSLDWADNGPVKIPDWLSDLPLEHLDIGVHGGIENLTAIGRLTRLWSLDLSMIPFDAFPSFILGLNNLHSLSLNFNGLNSIPDWIQNLPELCYLELRYNQLTDLPAGFAKIPNLRELDIRGNHFNKIPESILNFEFEKFRIGDNPLLEIPEEFRDTYGDSSAFILQYARDLHAGRIPKTLEGYEEEFHKRYSS